MSTTWIIAILIGATIIAGLAFYLGRLLMQLKQVKTAQQEKVNQRNKTLKNNIYTIAWAMKDGQCEPSEGCLRIWVLLDHLAEQPKPDFQQLYPGLYAMYQQVKDLPTHEARKKVKKSELRAMDKKRLAHEAEFKPLIDKDVATLVELYKSFADKGKTVSLDQMH